MLNPLVRSRERRTGDLRNIARTQSPLEAFAFATHRCSSEEPPQSIAQDVQVYQILLWVVPKACRFELPQAGRQSRHSVALDSTAPGGLDRSALDPRWAEQGSQSLALTRPLQRQRGPSEGSKIRSRRHVAIR